MVNEELKKQEEQIEENFPEDFYIYDKSNIRTIYKEIKSRIQEAYKISELIPIGFPNFIEKMDEIVFAGMGDSLTPALILKDYLETIDVNIPIKIANDYYLPKTVSKNALVICIDYEGNTEETLSMFKDAQRKKLRVMSIFSGGKLEELTNNYRVPSIKVPKGLKARFAFSYMLFPLVKSLEKLKIIEDHTENVNSLLKVLGQKDFEKLGIELSKKLYKKDIMIYCTNFLKSIAYRWKTQFNKNSKVLAHVALFPEICHNELCQYIKSSEKYHVVILNTDKDIRRMQKRISVTKKIISKNCETTEIEIKGGNNFTKFFTTVLIGDLASYYLALRYKRDPSEDTIIEELKKEMGPWLN